MKTSYSIIFFLLISSLAFLFHGCGELSGSDSEETLISGQVIEQSNGSAIIGAIVEITSPAALRQTITSDSLGNFTFSVEVDSAIDVTVRAERQGFDPVTTTFRLAPGADILDLGLALRNQNDSGGGDGGGDEGVGGESGGAAAIILTNITEPSINIAETGGIVNSAFTFELQDSAGRSIDLSKAVDVDFTIVSGPGGGESLTPPVVRTNSDGRATSNLFSGNAAGTVKIQAQVVRDDVDLTIQSKPIVIAIHGGFPDFDHFSLAPEKYNYEAYNTNNVRNPISVIVGDKFSNPVKPGTPVYFNTTGGTIQGSGATDDDGQITVDLISGDPRPTDAITGSGGRPGYATVTAMTQDENDNMIEKSINIVFSTREAIISATPTTFDLDPNGGASFSYTVTDLNGNPMAAGTQIAISGGEGMEITGDTDFTLGNHLFPGPGATEFSFSIRDTDEESNDPADLTLQITVTTPSGNTTTYSEISGIRRKAPGM